MTYSSLTSIDNLFQAWEEFKKGKRKKKDVQVFERHLEDNLFGLHRHLKNKTYHHGPYTDFYVHDSKRRHIHKASVYDRIVHHLLYKYLYGIFDKTFINDSYSCRLEKGTHKVVKRLEKYTRVVSQNYTRCCWTLKMDIKQFFASVNHRILLRLIAEKVKDIDILWLIKKVLTSFSTNEGQNTGIPLGNLTSQIFANIYLNELDQFVKHDLRIKHYLRYADDFLILDAKRERLKPNLISIGNFLQNNLKLQLHPKKIFLRKLIRGIDFCGYVVLPHYRVLRTKTKKRIFKRVLKLQVSQQSLQSYLGYFMHANTYQQVVSLKNLFYIGICT